MEQLEPMEQQPPRISQDGVALIKEIYELTHLVSISNDPAKRLRLTELTIKAQERKLL